MTSKDVSTIGQAVIDRKTAKEQLACLKARRLKITEDLRLIAHVLENELRMESATMTDDIIRADALGNRSNDEIQARYPDPQEIRDIIEGFIKETKELRKLNSILSEFE